MRLFLAILSMIIFPVRSTTYCVIKGNDLLAKIVEKCQGINDIFIPESDSYEFKGLSQDNFDRIFSNATDITGQMEISNTKIAIMNFSHLDMFVAGTIAVSHNSKLKEVNFPLLYYNGMNFAFLHNPRLEKLTFPLLRRFYMPYGYLRLENNTALQSFNLSLLNDPAVRDFTIKGNNALEIIEITFDPKQKEIYQRFNVHNKLLIEDNEALKQFKMEGNGINGCLDVFDSEKESIAGGIIEIVNNRALTYLPPLYKKRNITMKIRGNPQLIGEALKELKAAANENSSEIQEFGEPVTNLALLDICVYVYGQLELAASVEGWTSVRLDRVEGDVFTSEVPIDRLQFLLNTEIYGQFESSLCDFDFSEFKAGRKGIRRGCQTTTTEESTTIGEGENRTRTTGTTTTDETTTVTQETVETTRTTECSPTTEIKATEAMTTITQESTKTIITTVEISPETPLMTKGTTIGSTTTEEMTTGSQSTASQEIILTSPAAAPANSFPYRPVIIASAVLLIFFILLGTVLWAKKTKIKKEKAEKQELSSPSSQKSTSSASSR